MITDLRTYILADTAISAVIGTRLYPVVADQVSGTESYAVYSTIASTTRDCHTDSGVLRNDMVSISIHCPTATLAMTTAQLFRDRLSNNRTDLGSYDAYISVENFTHNYSDDDETHSATITLSITWS